MKEKDFSYFFEYLPPERSNEVPQAIRWFSGSGIYITAYIGKDESVTIPADVDGVPVCGVLGFGENKAVKSVSLPKDAETWISLAEGAFKNCANLETFAFDAEATRFIPGAFQGCNKLYNKEGLLILDGILLDDLKKTSRVHFEVPSSVKKIWWGIYNKNINLTSVVFASDVELLSSSFLDCNALTSITALGNLVIDASSIKNCPNLSTVTINGKLLPSSLLFSSPFEGCPKLIKDDYLIIGNVLLSYVGDKSKSEIVVPLGVEIVGSNAFKDCHSLKSVDFQNQVEELWPRAFERATSLKSIRGCKKIKRIGEEAFSGCWDLEDFDYPKDAEIGESAFNECRMLTNSSGLLIVNDELMAFDYDKYRQTEFPSEDQFIIKIPYGVKKIGGIDLNSPGWEIDEFVIPDTVTSMDPGQFMIYGIHSFKIVNESGAIVFDQSLFCEQEYQFLSNEEEFNAFCEDLESGVYASNQEKPSTQDTETAEKSVPSEGLVIDSGTVVDYCGSEKDLILPDGLTSIGHDAFQSTEIQTVILPEGIVEIGEDAFYGCEALTKVSFPSSLEQISDGAFEWCEKLPSITLNQGLKKIGSWAFHGCKKLREVRLPEGCTAIGNGAFSMCSILRNVYIPSSVCEVGEDAFEGCYDIKIHIADSQIISPDELYAITKKYDSEVKTVYLVSEPHLAQKANYDKQTEQPTAKTSKSENTAAPLPLVDREEELPLAPAKEASNTGTRKKSNPKTYIIENGELLSYKGKAFTPEIPGDIQVIGTGAFNENRELGCTAIPEGVKEIKTGAFRNCPNLFRIIIPNIPIKIEKDAFINCPELFIDTVPNSIAEQYCKENGIPYKTDALCAKHAANTAKKHAKAAKESVENTPKGSASSDNKTQCKKKPGRKFYEVDDNLRLIRYKGNAFYKQHLELPKDVVIIGRGAIVDDDRICFVTIPKSVTHIETGAFQNLPLLLRVIVPDTDIKIEKNAFINCPRYCIDTFSGSPTAEYCKHNGIPCETDDMCKTYFPEIVRKREKAEAKAKAKAEAEAKERAEQEQKRVDEDNNLKRVAGFLQQRLTALYQNSLTASQFDSMKNAVETTLPTVCDKQTWVELCKRGIPALPLAYLKETISKVSTASSVEEAYDMLPEWIASEYISAATDKRNEGRFRSMLDDLDLFLRSPVLPLFEEGASKDSTIRWFQSGSKAIVGDGKLFSEGLGKFGNVPELRSLFQTLGISGLYSLGQILDAIGEKAGAEYDRLSAALKKKNADLEALEVEAANLKLERSRLGLFQGKRKREIDELLEKIPERIQQIEEAYEKAKTM